MINTTDNIKKIKTKDSMSKINILALHQKTLNHDIQPHTWSEYKHNI